VDCLTQEKTNTIIGYTNYKQFSIDNSYYVNTTIPISPREHLSHIVVGGYHNIGYPMSYANYGNNRDTITIDPLIQSNAERGVYGWGSNVYGQTNVLNIPSTSTPQSYDNYGSGTILASKYGTIASTYKSFFGVGATFTNQLNYIPYYSDFGVGNGYSVYSHYLGYVLFKFVPFSGWAQRWVVPPDSNRFVTNSIFDRCPGSPYPPIRTYRTVKKIRTGRDYCLFLSNEGKVITPFCHYEISYIPRLPRHFGNTVRLADYNINVPPAIFSEQPLADIQIGYFHSIALTTDNRILMWGVSPSLNFSRQYYQTVIPPGLDRSRAIIQIAAGKYHSTAILGSVTGDTYFTTLRSFGEPESSN
jgi:alpha-tubulin suppressor-like RCC1 family protein